MASGTFLQETNQTRTFASSKLLEASAVRRSTSPICLCCASFCAARAKRSARPRRISRRCSSSEARGVDDVSIERRPNWSRNRNLRANVSAPLGTRWTRWKRTTTATLRHRHDSLLNVSSSRKERLFTVELCQQIRTRRDVTRRADRRCYTALFSP